MKICRFARKGETPRPGILTEQGTVRDISAHCKTLMELLEHPDPSATLKDAPGQDPEFALSEARLFAPCESQEVWAAGVTYLRSKKARMEESDFSANAYDKVYEAPRPELFFKSLPEKVVHPGEAVGIRRDSKWNVP